MFPPTLLDALGSEDEEICLDAMETLGDLLEYGDWTPEQAAPVLEALLRVVCVRQSATLQEVALNSLIIGFSRRNVIKIDMNELLECLGDLSSDIIPYALELLGLSRTRTHLGVLKKYVSSANSTISEAAMNAIIEIG